MCHPHGVDAADARHRQVIEDAWRDYGDARALVGIDELSAMVSTNRVYRLALDDGSHVIGKSSNYGSFFLFAEDHDRLHRANRLLQSGPYGRFMAEILTTDGRPYLWYDGEMWAVFYEEVEVRDRLPPILTEATTQCFFRTPLQIGADGCIAVPDGPGLGVEIDEERLGKVIVMDSAGE